MVMCFAPDCKHYSEKHGCRYFVFPKDAAEKKRWLKLLRREDREPTKNSLVCSCHFVNADRKNGPTLFEHNKFKRFEVTTPEKKKKRLVYKTADQRILLGESPVAEERLIVEAGPSVNLAEECVPSTSRTSVEPGLSVREVAEDLEVLNIAKSPKIHVRQTPALPAMVEAENYFLMQEVSGLQEKLNRAAKTFTFEQIEGDDSKVRLYTGLPNAYTFNMLFDLIKNMKMHYYYGWTAIGIPKKDQLLMTLMKLKLNLYQDDLAERFNVTHTTISNITLTWLHLLHDTIYKQLMAKIPSKEKNKLCLPSCFSNFTNCRIILDCTEIYTVMPKNMEVQRTTYSSYKHRNTLKGLVGVAPNGVVTYLSNLYPGGTSDKQIVADCGILDKLKLGDLVIADKGFLIEDLLPVGVSLNIPPFLTTAQFTPQQVFRTESIAKARIHVERAIRRIKLFDILDNIPASLIPQSTYVFQVCGALTNLQYPLIKEVEELYDAT